VTVPGLDETESSPRKTPAKKAARGGRRRSGPDAKPPAKEVRAQLVNGQTKANGNRKSIKRDMRCRVQGCKSRSKGPRFGYICEGHLKKLSKAEQQKEREKWNQKHAV